MRIPTPTDWNDDTEADGAPLAQSPRARMATGTPAPRRLDGIEAGEIVDTRSLVIRSQKVPVVEWNNDEPTETIRPAFPTAKPRSWRWTLLVAAIGCGVAAVILTMQAKPASMAPLEAPVQMLGTTLDGEAHATLVRAEGIAASPVLRAALETDASTLADMARDGDISFSLRPQDVIEVFQVRAGKRSLLLRIPANAPPLAAPAAGHARLDAVGGHAIVVANVGVANERSEMGGEIVLSTPIDLAAVSTRLAEHARGAVLVGLREPIVMLAPSASPNVTLPVKTIAADAGSLSLAAVVDEPTTISAWILMTLSALLLAVFAVLLVRSRRAMREGAQARKPTARAR